MIFRFNNFLKENLSFKKIPGEIVSIDLNDYKTTYENIFHKNYRNLKTGEIVSLGDIFNDKIIAISIEKNGKEVLKSVYGNITKTNLLRLKNGSFYLEFSTDKTIERIKTNGIINVYDIEKYRIDFFKKFIEEAPKIVEGYDLYGNKIIIKMKTDYEIILSNIDNTVRINNNHEQYYGGVICYLTITKPILGKRFRYYDPIVDPFGEESWDESFFTFEKLGISSSVSDMTDLIWEKYKNSPPNLNQVFIMKDLECGDFKIKELKITNFVDSSTLNNMYFSIHHSKIKENGDYCVRLSQNLYFKKNKTILNHELQHAYEHFKRKFNNYSVDKNSEIFRNMKLNEKDKKLEEIFDMMYYIDMSEIRAYYNQSVMYIKIYKKRFKKSEDILKNTPIMKIYQKLKNFKIEEKIKSLPKEDMMNLIEIYYKIRNDIRAIENPKGYKNRLEYFKDLFNTIFKLNRNKKINITQNEIDGFIRNLNSEIEYKKKILLKYIGRLRVIIKEEF